MPARLTRDLDPARRDLTARRRGERGQGMVEYAFILILVVMVVLISVAVLGSRTAALYSNISSGLGP